MEIWRFFGIVLCIVACANGNSDPLDNNQLTQFDDAAHVPGEPLSPIDYQNAATVHDSPVLNDQFHSDPIELAGLYEGDIILSSTKGLLLFNDTKNGVVYEKQKWTGGVIPYFISSEFNALERSVIAKAMSEYHAKTCIKFRPRTSEQDYIHITKGTGCSSHVGRSGGGQQVTLGQGCVFTGIIIHELMHAVGFWHEQSRWDRDNFVNIYFQNIQQGMEFNFRKFSWRDIQNLSAPYDVTSVMHYGSYAFSRDRKSPTILAKDPNQKLGQRDNFSKIDILKINKLYNCESGSPATPPPPTPQPDTGCSDSHIHCPYWSKQGECSKNGAWMLANCKKSCNECNKPCNDLNQYCSVWAKRGDCTWSTDYMNIYCSKSCRSCRKAPVIGGVGINGLPTRPTGVPHFICEDKEKYCSYWASRGECTKNPRFMGKYCPKSCHVCI